MMTKKSSFYLRKISKKKNGGKFQKIKERGKRKENSREGMCPSHDHIIIYIGEWSSFKFKRVEDKERTKKKKKTKERANNKAIRPQQGSTRTLRKFSSKNYFLLIKRFLAKWSSHWSKKPHILVSCKSYPRRKIREKGKNPFPFDVMDVCACG